MKYYLITNDEKDPTNGLFYNFIYPENAYNEKCTICGKSEFSRLIKPMPIILADCLFSKDFLHYGFFQGDQIQILIGRSEAIKKIIVTFKCGICVPIVLKPHEQGNKDDVDAFNKFKIELSILYPTHVIQKIKLDEKIIKACSHCKCMDMGIGSNYSKFNDIQLFKGNCNFDIGIIDGSSTEVKFAFISERFKDYLEKEGFRGLIYKEVDLLD